MLSCNPFCPFVGMCCVSVLTGVSLLIYGYITFYHVILLSVCWCVLCVCVPVCLDLWVHYILFCLVIIFVCCNLLVLVVTVLV